MTDSLGKRLDRALAHVGATAVLPLVIVAIPWAQELIDQLHLST